MANPAAGRLRRFSGNPSCRFLLFSPASYKSSSTLYGLPPSTEPQTCRKVSGGFAAFPA